MTSSPSEPLSLSERLDIVIGMSNIALRAIGTLFVLPLPSRTGPSTWMGRLIFPAMRRAYDRFTIRQLQVIFAPQVTWAAVKDVATAKGVETSTMTLADGLKAQWIGSPAAKRVIVYLHAGGYIMYASTDQLRYICGVREFLIKQGCDCSILVLSYDLLPDAKFPTQLEQLTKLLNHLFETGKKPSDVAIFGASAGAHLGLTLLSHMSHPYPAIPELNLSENLAAMILLSPMTWTNVDTSSVTKNEAKDMVPKRLLSEWTVMHGSDIGPNSYTEPAIAPAEWWKENKVDKVLLLAGGDETLLDSCTEWANKFKVYNESKLSYFIGPSENHVQPVVDCTIGSFGAQSKFSEAWLKGNLWSEG